MDLQTHMHQFSHKASVDRIPFSKYWVMVLLAHTLAYVVVSYRVVGAEQQSTVLLH